jgi:hypothetical protein
MTAAPRVADAWFQRRHERTTKSQKTQRACALKSFSVCPASLAFLRKPSGVGFRARARMPGEKVAGAFMAGSFGRRGDSVLS